MRPLSGHRVARCWSAHTRAETLRNHITSGLRCDLGLQDVQSQHQRAKRGAAREGRYFYLATASLSVLGYHHDLDEPVIHMWNDARR